jgi:hypothetical protein
MCCLQNGFTQRLPLFSVLFSGMLRSICLMCGQSFVVSLESRLDMLTETPGCAILRSFVYMCSYLQTEEPPKKKKGLFGRSSSS